MGFENVFVHMSDAYFKTGKAVGTYEDHVIDNIIKRADKLRPILIGSKAPDLFMIKATDRDKIAAMGFENVKTSAEVTQLFYDHTNEINPLFYKLSEIFLILRKEKIKCG